MTNRYPSVQGKSVPKGRVNPIRRDNAESGLLLSQNLSSRELFEWEIRHDLINQSDVDTLLAFYYDNEGQYIDTRMLADGWTYFCKHVHEPAVSEINGTLRTVTQRLEGIRALYVGNSSELLALFDEGGIVGSSPVTAWNNDTVIAAGGADYDLDVTVGGGTLGTTTQNGETVVTFNGSVGLETTSGQTITQAGTVFIAFKMDTHAADQYLLSARSDSAASWNLLFDVPGDDIVINAGTTLTGPTGMDGDTDWHVATAVVNGANSLLFVSALGTVTGDAGSENLDFGTLGISLAGTLGLDGSIASMVVYDAALDQWKRNRIEGFLQTKYGVSA